MIDPGYFEKKRRELGMDRADVLADVQALIEKWYPGKVRVRQLHQGTLRIVTPSAAVANELRMRQFEILEGVVWPDGRPRRLAISIAQLRD